MFAASQSFTDTPASAGFEGTGYERTYPATSTINQILYTPATMKARWRESISNYGPHTASSNVKRVEVCDVTADERAGGASIYSF